MPCIVIEPWNLALSDAVVWQRPVCFREWMLLALAGPVPWVPGRCVPGCRGRGVPAYRLHDAHQGHGEKIGKAGAKDGHLATMVHERSCYASRELHGDLQKRSRGPSAAV